MLREPLQRAVTRTGKPGGGEADERVQLGGASRLEDQGEAGGSGEVAQTETDSHTPTLRVTRSLGKPRSRISQCNEDWPASPGPRAPAGGGLGPWGPCPQRRPGGFSGQVCWVDGQSRNQEADG